MFNNTNIYENFGTCKNKDGNTYTTLCVDTECNYLLYTFSQQRKDFCDRQHINVSSGQDKTKITHEQAIEWALNHLTQSEYNRVCNSEPAEDMYYDFMTGLYELDDDYRYGCETQIDVYDTYPDSNFYPDYD